MRSISQTPLHQVLQQLPRLVSPQELISTQVCEASVRTDMVLPGMYQPDRSWAEAAMDEQPHPASSASPFCSSLVPVLSGRHRVLGTALARFGQWGSVDCLSEKAPEAVPGLDPSPPPKAEPVSSE